MSNKPTDLARWAVTAAGVDAQNITVPASSEQDTGWTLGQAPPSGKFNWWMSRVHRWLVWLNDGDVSFHNLAAGGTLGISGDTTLSGKLNVSGDSTLAKLGAGDSTLGSLSVTGGASVGGTLGVSGLVTATGGVNVGTARYKHGARELDLDISCYRPNGDTAYVTFSQLGFITGFTGACLLRCPIPLEAGKRILSYEQFFNINGTSATLSGVLRHQKLSTAANTDVPNSSFSVNTGNTLNSARILGINHTMIAGESYFIELTAQSANQKIHGAIITYDDP